MANPFMEGVATAQEQNKQNPFNIILGRFQEAQARRYKEDMERKKEEAELSKSLQILNKDYLYKTELEKFKAEEERKGLIPKGLAEGKITETEETGEGTFEGTPFGAVGKRFKARTTETPVYLVDPATGQLKQVGTTEKGAKVVSTPQPTAEKVQMASNLDAMLGSLNDMETKLKDPKILLRNLNPFAEREFKAILDTYDKTSAIAAGGKQLTQTELNLIRKTRPTLLDFSNPEAIKYKLNKQREIIQNARARLSGGMINQQQVQNNPEYQKYLQAIGQ